jgi:DNA-binding IclR family transcriptional regulator
MRDGVSVSKQPNYPIESVDNALRLLNLFRGQKVVRVSDASRTLGVARSTAHRLLAMLSYHGFVEQDADTRVYVPGPALRQLGASVVRDMDLRQVARPCLERLSREVNETAHVVIAQGSDVLFLDGVESGRTLRAGNRTGQVMPAACTAGGKVLLAELPTGQLRQLYPDGLPRLTERSIGTIDELEKELEQIKAQGFAENHGGSEDGLSAVAVPIRSLRGTVTAAISVAAPSSRLQPSWVPQVVSSAQAAAAEIGQLLI